MNVGETRAQRQDTRGQYEHFGRHQDRVVALASEARRLLVELGLDQRAATVDDVIVRARADTFKVLILGEFKTGKSTFINALLGQEVLPSYARPCTAIINEVKWGDSPAARLHHKAVGGIVPPPQDIPVSAIERYVVIPKDDASSEGTETPYEYLELFWPLALCRNRVEIIDSPGLNESSTREQTTLDYVPKVDAVVFVFSAERAGSRSEMAVIERLQSLGYQHMFYVFNRYDTIRAQDREDVRSFAYQRLGNCSSLGREGIFFVSARASLDSRLGVANGKVDDSGVPELEKRIERFLVTDRGRIKTLQPASQLAEMVTEMLKLLPEQKRILHVDRTELERRARDAERPLQELRLRRENIRVRLGLFRQDVRDIVRQRAAQHYAEMASNVGRWLEGYQIKQPFNMLSTDAFAPKGAAERVVQEVAAFLKTKIEGATLAWQKDNLQPFAQERIERLKEDLNQSAAEFLAKAEEIRVNLSAGPMAEPKLQAEVDAGKVSPLERLGAAGIGLLFGDPVSIGMGWAFGFGAMLKNLVLQIGVGVAAVVLGVTNPWLLLGAMFGAGGIAGFLRGSKTNTTIKEKVGAEVANALRIQAGDLAEKVAVCADKELLKVETSIVGGMDRYIGDVTSQLELARKTAASDQQQITKALAKLDTCEKDAFVLKQQIDALVHEVARG